MFQKTQTHVPIC